MSDKMLETMLELQLSYYEEVVKNLGSIMANPELKDHKGLRESMDLYVKESSLAFDRVLNIKGLLIATDFLDCLKKEFISKTMKSYSIFLKEKYSISSEEVIEAFLKYVETSDIVIA